MYAVPPSSTAGMEAASGCSVRAARSSSVSRRTPHVCLAIYDRYEGFGSLHGIQVMGLADLVKPFRDDYNAHAAWKKISLEALRKLPSPMHLIRVRPPASTACFPTSRSWAAPHGRRCCLVKRQCSEIPTDPGRNGHGPVHSDLTDRFPKRQASTFQEAEHDLFQRRTAGARTYRR